MSIVRLSSFLCLLFFLAIAQGADSPGEVRFTRGTIEVPTYVFGRAETVAPLFQSVEKGGLYPYTAMDRDSLSGAPQSVTYEALTLENEYVRVVLLPALGGRIWQAEDKKAGREIFYRTRSIKPSQYNQRGAWPVGGLEVYGPFDAHMLTWPGEPWAWASRQHSDGSVSVLLTHVEHFFRNKVSMEVTLRPGRSFLELSIRLRNDNLLPNRYLFWTNAGIPATEGTRFVYPMTRTIGHDSANLGTWPVVEGVDLSWYKNNKNMLGVFGLDLYDNFIAGYDYAADYGTVCFTDRRQARGVKTWTWGTGPAAMRHMAAYSDGEGPYIEVQSGRFVWDGNYEFIDPGRSDGWTEYWYGMGGLGGLTTATRDAGIHLRKPADGSESIDLTLVPTGSFPGSRLEIRAGDDLLWSQQADVRVGEPLRSSVSVKGRAASEPLEFRVITASGERLVDYGFRLDQSHPDAVFARDAIPRSFGPLDSLPIEEIFQKALGHEKFGQLEEARSVYRSALEKDPGYAPAHLQLGLLDLERWDHQGALGHFEKVLERDPVNGDAHYYLAVAKFEVGRLDEARRHLYRLLPNSGRYERRDYGLALIDFREGRPTSALNLLRSAVGRQPRDLAARKALALALRRSGFAAEADQEVDAILLDDPTSSFAAAEKWLSLAPDRSAAGLEQLDKACARHVQGYLELATEYFRLSAWREAERVAQAGIQAAESRKQRLDPLLYYYQAYALDKEGKNEASGPAFQAAGRLPLDLEIYPFRREDIGILRRILEVAPNQANAAVLLGDILYSRNRRDEAVVCWRKALATSPRHFSALRDLGMALMEAGTAQESLSLLTQAAEVRPDHVSTTVLVARLHARGGHPELARQAFERALQKAPGQDLLIENLAGVEAQLGNPRKALDLVSGHTFNPRHQSYSLLRLYQALRCMLALEILNRDGLAPAVEQVRLAGRPPGNLGVDDFVALQSSRLAVFQALLERRAGEESAAMDSWRAAARTNDDDIEGEGLFRAMGMIHAGDRAAAEQWFREFERVNRQRKSDNSTEVRTQAHYLAGVYEAFRGREDAARQELEKALVIDQSYLFARQALEWMKAGLFRGLVD